MCLRLAYEKLTNEEKINIEKQLDKYLKENTKLKVTFHAVQRMSQRGINFKFLKSMIKSKEYIIKYIEKYNGDIRVTIVSNSPIRNILYLKIILSLKSYTVITAIVMKEKVKEVQKHEYERI